MDGVAKTRDYATDSANRKRREAKMLEFCTASLKYELDSLMWKESTRGELKMVRRKVADAKGKANSLASGLRCAIF